MKLVVDKVVDNGTHASERILLDVTGDCDLVDYLITDTTYIKENTVSNKLRHMFWFLKQKVIAGDKIILYTKRGKNSDKKINAGKNTEYTIHWNLHSSVWNNTGDAAIVINIQSWKPKKVV